MLASAQGSVKSALAPSFLISPSLSHSLSHSLCVHVCVCRVIEVCDLAVGLAGVRQGMRQMQGGEGGRKGWMDGGLCCYMSACKSCVCIYEQHFVVEKKMCVRGWMHILLLNACDVEVIVCVCV